MKASKFNTRLPLSDHTDIIFNSLTEESRIIPSLLDLQYETLSNDARFDFFNGGFLVSDNMKEDDIVVVGFGSLNDTKQFKLTINPTLNCNFRCWYCYENHKPKSSMSHDTFQKTVKAIEFIARDYDSIELAFFGGEPMLKFNEMVLPLIEHTSKLFSKERHSYIVTFTTNGFLINDKIIEKLSNYNVGFSQITLDGGKKSHNLTRVAKESNSFDTILDNIRKMASAGLPVLLRINVTKENILSAHEIPKLMTGFKDVIKSKIQILIQQVWQDSQNDILDKIWELYEAFMNAGFTPWPRRFNFYKHICYADTKHSAVINHDGKIFKCTAIDFDKAAPDGKISDDGCFDIKHYHNKRLAKRRANTLCPDCRIFPVCNGGCAKNVDQAKNRDYCLHPTEAAKDKVVRNILREQLHMAKLGLSWKDAQ